MHFVEAVTTLPVSFSPTELESILREVKPKWHGKLRSLFIVLSDDMIKRKFRGKPSEKPKDTEKESTSSETGTRNGRGPKRGPEPESSRSSKHPKT